MNEKYSKDLVYFIFTFVEGPIKVVVGVDTGPLRSPGVRGRK